MDGESINSVSPKRWMVPAYDLKIPTYWTKHRKYLDKYNGRFQLHRKHHFLHSWLRFKIGGSQIYTRYWAAHWMGLTCTSTCSTIFDGSSGYSISFSTRYASNLPDIYKHATKMAIYNVHVCLLRYSMSMLESPFRISASYLAPAARTLIDVHLPYFLVICERPP